MTLWKLKLTAFPKNMQVLQSGNSFRPSFPGTPERATCFALIPSVNRPRRPVGIQTSCSHLWVVTDHSVYIQSERQTDTHEHRVLLWRGAQEEVAHSSMAMKMDLNTIIEQMETGEQDTALTALQSYNKEVNISTAAEGSVLTFIMNGYVL